MNKYLVAYFTGTGSSEVVAKELVKQFDEINIANQLLYIKDEYDYNHNNLIIIYPVHAFNVPEQMEKWLDQYQNSNLKNVVVIAVSGGGEMSPNTISHSRVKKKLKKKGIIVTYEAAIVMPSNAAIIASEQINSLLLKVLPLKIREIIADIVVGKSKMIKVNKFDYLFTHAYVFERMFARYWGKRIKCNDNCNQCGLCIRGCPTENIQLESNKITFNNKCCMCLKCLYYCPQNALYPTRFKFVILKEGYNINDFIEKSKNATVENIVYPKSILWKGVNDYLEDVSKR